MSVEGGQSAVLGVCRGVGEGLVVGDAAWAGTSCLWFRDGLGVVGSSGVHHHGVGIGHRGVCRAVDPDSPDGDEPQCCDGHGGDPTTGMRVVAVLIGERGVTLCGIPAPGSAWQVGVLL